MKAKKVLGLALSAMMAISAVVPWTGLTATAAEEPQVANASQQMEEEPTTIWVNVEFWCGEEYLDGERVTLNVGNNHTSVLEALDTFKRLYLEGYELAEKGDFWVDADQEYLKVEVRKIATTKEIGVNYWDVENNKQAGEGKVVVDKDANNVNMTQLDVPDGYELTGYIGDYQINDGWIFVEVRPVEEDMVTVGLNYWDIVNNKQVAEGSVLVDADATYVNTSEFTDVPSGYELVWVGDLQINDGWVWVEVRPAADSKTVRVNYWDVVNNEQAGEGEVTVAADANNVNMSQLDVPDGYELTGYIGDYQINDGWIFVEVRPVDEPDDSDDDDRPSSGGGYYPSREEEIDDPTTPEASDPGTTPGGGSAGPGGAGDGAVAVEDPTDTLGDNDVPRVNAPQTGRKIAGSIALLAGAAAVAVVTLKKRKDK